METKSSVVDDEYWLLKVPPSMARMWNRKQPSENEIIGCLDIQFHSTGKIVGGVKQAFVTVPGDGEEPEKCYAVVGQTNTKRMRVFRELPEEKFSGDESEEEEEEEITNAGEVHFVGTIKKALALQLDLSAYRNSTSAKLLDKRSVDRTAREVAAKKIAPRKRKVNYLKGASIETEHKKQTMIKIDTGIKLDVDDDTKLRKGQKMFTMEETMKIMFKCFEKYPHMSFQELKDFFGERASSTVIKAVLKQIAEYKRSGDHTGKYGLKRNFLGADAKAKEDAAKLVR